MTKSGEQTVGGWGKSPRRAVLFGLAVGVPVSVLFLWLAVRDVDLDAVRAAFHEADYGLVVLAAVVVAFVYVFQGLRWQVIAASERPSSRGFVEMVVGAVAVNNVVPGRLGELLRAYWLAVAAPMPSGRALGTVGIDRTYDVATLFAFLLVSLPAVASAGWIGRIVLGVAIVLLVIGAGLLAARVYTRRRPRERRGRGRLRRIARDTLDSLAAPLGRKRLVRALIMSVLAWSAFGVAVWAVARSVGVELSPSECLFVTGAINLGVAIPSSPGFVGTYQWLGVAALGAFGVPPSQALAFSILLHACWYLPTTLVGGLLLLFRIDWRRGPHTPPTEYDPLP